jgi:predicted AAA+ superfamily ATPase
LGAQVYIESFKLLFVDVGLSQFMLDLKTGDWLLDAQKSFINKGLLAEALVGQELIAYEHPSRREQLYYWKRDARASEAEVDYVIQQKQHIIPVEVKSGKGKTLRSMQSFLESHTNSAYGIRVSTHNYSVHETIHSYPLYAIARISIDGDQEVKDSLLALCVNAK